MRPAENIKRLIKNAKIKINQDVKKTNFAELVNELEKTQKISPAETPPNIWRIIMKSKMTKFSSAVAFVFCVLGMLVFFGNGETLYAQIKDAFEKASSIHVVMTEFREGAWFKEHEIWYKSNEGVREEERYKKQTDIRIDNNQYEWRYTVGDTMAAEIASYRAQDGLIEDLYEWLRFDHVRMPSGDKVIRSVPCEMYTLSTSNKSGNINIWVDENYRIMEFEGKEQRNGQVIRFVASIEYDIEIDGNLFLPNFDTDVNIVGPRELIEETLPLENTIFKRESLGFVFAVHELKFGNGFKYLVCSNRLTEQTREEIGVDHPWTYYGGVDLFERYDLDTSNKPILLARMSHDGIQITWYALIPGGNKSKQSAQCDIDVQVHTANELEEKLKSQGLPTQEKFRLNLTTSEFDYQLLSLSEICREVYSFGEEFGPIVHSFLLTEVVTNSDDKRVIRWKKPGVELSEEEYLKNCENRMTWYLNQN